MKTTTKLTLTIIAIALGAIAAAKSDSTAPIKLADVDYLPRWAKNSQHEYTPAGQEDLEHWADMITVDYYPDAKDGDGLAAKANAVLENYKSHRAMVIKTDSVPRTPEKPAEHLVVVIFPTPDFLEAAFARFKMNGEAGLAVVRSHREYGKKAGPQMGDWMNKNGPAVEKALMALDKIPAEAKK